MDDNPYIDGQALAALFSRFEHTLKRTGFLRARPDAQADWNKFALSLGNEFYEEVRRLGLAETLISDPPRKLMADGLQWKPEHPEALTDVVALFERGVCRVRNSLIHGEKFVGGDRTFKRDARLVRDALRVLQNAEKRLPKIGL